MTNESKIQEILEEFEQDRASEGVFVSPSAYSKAINSLSQLLTPSRVDVEGEVQRFKQSLIKLNDSGWNIPYETILDEFELVLKYRVTTDLQPTPKTDSREVLRMRDDLEALFQKTKGQEDDWRKFGLAVFEYLQSKEIK